MRIREEVKRLVANEQQPIDERQAAALLGLGVEEVRRLSRLSSLGRAEKREDSERMIFTYEELRGLCLLAAPSSD